MEKSIVNQSFWKNKKIFITGHSGFKGSWLSLLLISLGSKVTGLSKKQNDNDFLFKKLNIQHKVNNYFGDINNIKLLTKIIKINRPEIIFHLAAQSLVSKSFHEPLETFKTNSIGTMNLIEAARLSKSVKAIIIITTDKCYKDTNKKNGYQENDPVGGKDFYSSSKASAELIVNSYQEIYIKNIKKVNCGIASVRAGNVIGGGDWAKQRLIPDIIKSVKEGKKLKIRNLNYVRPWQFVLDPLNGYLILAEQLFLHPKIYSAAWNFGPTIKNSKSVGWIVSKLQNSLKKELVITNENKKNKFIETEYLYLNSKKARKLLNWKPKYNLSESIKRVSDWYNVFLSKGSLEKITNKQIQEFIKK